MHLFLNEGEDHAPDYLEETLVQGPSGPIVVQYGSSSPVVADMDEDRRLDLLTGSGFSKLHLIEGEEIIPDALPDFASPVRLDAPWPQPAPGSARLSFSLASPADLDLSVYDTTGRRVARLAAGPHGSGGHERSWDGRDRRGRDLPAGLYFVRLEAAGRVETRKLLLLR